MGIKFAIIGLGKFGGRELDYGSDLDIIFVYSMHPLTPSFLPPQVGEDKGGELLKGRVREGVFKLFINSVKI